MIICAAADIHYPREGEAWTAALAREMCASGADVLVLAGDIAVGPEKHYRKLLRMFDEFAGPKLLVPGNHDLWSNSRHPDTPRRYRVSLRNIVEDQGFHYLPGAPVCVGDVGFVGTIGWYDYSLRQIGTPRPGLRVKPFQASRDRIAGEVASAATEDGLLWEELSEQDYAGKGLVWTESGRTQNMVWNDGIYVDWRESDGAVTRRMTEELARDVAQIEGEPRYLIGVSHFLPFAEFLDDEPPSEDVANAFCRAYMGSPAVGEVFLSDPRFRLVLCGHTHEQKVIEVGDLVAANCSVGDEKAGPLLLTLPEDSD